MNRSLEELGKEYERDILELDEKINRYRQRLRHAKATKNHSDIFTCERLLQVFENERLEMMQIVRKIKDYYEKGE